MAPHNQWRKLPRQSGRGAEPRATFYTDGWIDDGTLEQVPMRRGLLYDLRTTGEGAQGEGMTKDTHQRSFLRTLARLIEGPLRTRYA